MAAPLDLNGVKVFKGWLDRAAQEELVAAVRTLAAAAPLMRYTTPWGKPMSVRMTAAGRVGWVVERGRYRYSDTHPETGRPWPAIPAPALAVWQALADWAEGPDSLLVNWYGEGARMGMHRDANENAYDAPVVSISLGDPAVFRVGGLERGGSTVSTTLESGDVAVMGGAARLVYHGVDRIRFGGSTLLSQGGRLNLTLRVVRDDGRTTRPSSSPCSGQKADRDRGPDTG